MTLRGVAGICEIRDGHRLSELSVDVIFFRLSF